MPSQRFYRLSQEKQHLIWKASMKEFTSTSYEKVSINKIIREAGISRGSFYTYFEDKQDLLSFLLEDTRKKWTDFCLERLEETDGDIFPAMEGMMHFGIEFCKNNNMFVLHKNLIMYPDMMTSKCVANEMDFEKAVHEEFLGKVDRKKLKDDTAEGVLLLVKLCTISLITGFAAFYANPEREEQIKEEYKKTLKVLRYGAYKASENDQVEEKADE